MPSLCGITLRVHSQYDAKALLEYDDPSPWTETHNNYELSETKNADVAIGSTSSAVDVYIPLYAHSQFWLAYDITEFSNQCIDHEVKCVYFKLFIDGKPVVSWGVNSTKQVKGKTFFALNDHPSRGKNVAHQVAGVTRPLQRKTLYFGEYADGQTKGRKTESRSEETVMEVRVFRAKGRRRVFDLPALPPFKSEGSHGIRLRSTGDVRPEDPQRFFTYALIDAIDEPFVIFRYHVSTNAQLRGDLGLLPPADRHVGPGEESDEQNYHALKDSTPALHTQRSGSEDDAEPIKRAVAAQATQPAPLAIPKLESLGPHLSGPQSPTDPQKRSFVPSTDVDERNRLALDLARVTLEDSPVLPAPKPIVQSRSSSLSSLTALPQIRRANAGATLRSVVASAVRRRISPSPSPSPRGPGPLPLVARRDDPVVGDGQIGLDQCETKQDHDFDESEDGRAVRVVRL